MPIKKSDLYSSLWASCDELRGGMDASQYKDYVLFMLFIKYVTDKYGNSTDFAPPVTIPNRLLKLVFGGSLRATSIQSGHNRRKNDSLPAILGFECCSSSFASVGFSATFSHVRCQELRRGISSPALRNTIKS
jgi:hypothetical protein